MAELEFRRIEITDKQRAEECLRKSNFRGCEYTFGNNYVWRNVYNVEVCFSHGMYFCKFGRGNDIKFNFPAGGGDVREAVEPIMEYCRENGIAPRIGANKQITELITAQYPEALAEYQRDLSDYVYLAEDLETLKGKKYHGKRNHLNRFYENDWSFEPMTPENIPECIAMNERWCEENITDCDVADDENEQSKREEQCIVRCSFKHFDELGYVGSVLRVNGGVQAFTFGEPSASDCFVVHVEKALRDYQGAYTAVNAEFVKSLGGKFTYINREEDTGAENLRRAKLSYHPVFLEDKFDITFGGNEK